MLHQVFSESTPDSTWTFETCLVNRDLGSIKVTQTGRSEASDALEKRLREDEQISNAMSVGDAVGVPSSHVGCVRTFHQSLGSSHNSGRKGSKEHSRGEWIHIHIEG